MKNLHHLLLAAVFAFASLPAMAGWVTTPHQDEEELRKALQEALPGNMERVERMMGQHAGALSNIFNASNKFALVGYIILFALMGVVAVIGIIAIIGYGFSKKSKRNHDDERLGPP